MEATITTIPTSVEVTDSFLPPPPLLLLLLSSELNWYSLSGRNSKPYLHGGGREGMGKRME